MANPDDETKTPHAPGSQPSTRPGSDEPQTITAPTPPVARTSDPPDQADLADEGDESERSRADEAPGTTSEDD
ncbi:hypothetical protein G3I60_02615 [Streptomyces sp. SID13666]|uniref:hypothetical protein n=1 Tax=unclassified Streptomyces TaxID=2593676 RepID=UPI0013BECD75|nr:MULTISPECIES: hypothetical protein [unclassified Streptomyces]NEA53096.1 hypothetical protein [Streptomyces sp. SID13666]NEA69577.1 hypothetical protein [Streptomyces sp. SID13588]